MPIHTLPTELIRMIAETFQLNQRYQLAGLIRTNKRLKDITAPYLYTNDSIEMAFEYAARRDKMDCFLKAVRERALLHPWTGGKPPHLTLLDCCAYGSINVAARLVQMFPGMLTQDSDGQGRRALAIAAGRGQVEIVSWLLTLPQIVPNEIDNLGATPLTWACHFGKVSVVNKLLSLPNTNINHIDNSGETPIEAALEMDQVGVMRTLLRDNRLNLRLVNQNILVKSADKGQIDAFRLLLSYYATNDVIRDFWAYDALWMAFFCERFDMVRAFLNTAIDINTTTVGQHGQRSVHPMLWVVLGYQQPIYRKMFKLLFEFPNLDVNIRCSLENCSPLIYAIKKTKNSQARMLIQRNCRINDQDGFGYTALMWAIMNGNTPMVRLLLGRRGIDLSIKDNNGMPALCHATAGRHYDIMGFLLNHRLIDVNIRNREGLTPLMLAVENRRYVMSRLLVEKGGIDYDIEDNVGKTVFDHANRGTSWRRFASLVRAGAAGQRGRRLPRSTRL